MAFGMRNTAIAIAAAAAGLASAGTASAAILTTTADALVQENSANADGSGATSSGSGTGTAISIRQNFAGATPNKNEIGVFKFNFAGLDKSTVTGATLNVYMHRASNNNSGKNLALYMLPFGDAGANWTESGITFSTMPGLTFDGNSVTTGTQNLTSLGSSQLAASPAYDAEGSLVTLNLPASFVSAVQASGANDLVTIYIGYTTSSNGNWNVVSKEATSYATTGSFTAGAKAAFLDVTTVAAATPEPAALAALGLLGGAFVRRRRA